MSLWIANNVIVRSVNCSLTLLLEFFAFLRLKYVEKDTSRPFEVPFGNAGAWTITIPKIIVLSGVLFAQSSHVWLFCGSFNVAMSMVYLLWSNYQQKARLAAGKKSSLSSSSPLTTPYGTGSLS